MDMALPWAVVYVDDEQFNLDELKSKLEPRLANPLILFNHASDFIDWIGHTHERIGAVLIDLLMPNMSGLELIQWIRRHRPDLRPLIIVTGLQDKYTQKQAEEAGADAYLIKPVSIGTLLSALTELDHHTFELQKKSMAPVDSSDLPLDTPATPAHMVKRGSSQR